MTRSAWRSCILELGGLLSLNFHCTMSRWRDRRILSSVNSHKLRFFHGRRARQRSPLWAMKENARPLAKELGQGGRMASHSVWCTPRRRRNLWNSAPSLSSLFSSCAWVPNRAVNRAVWSIRWSNDLAPQCVSILPRQSCSSMKYPTTNAVPLCPSNNAAI